MTPPEVVYAAGGPRRRRNMNFRKSKAPRPTPGQMQRQSRVVQSAWHHFGEPGLVIAFLNTRHDALDARPIQLAIESDEGLQRVERLLKELESDGSPSSHGRDAMTDEVRGSSSRC